MQFIVSGQRIAVENFVTGKLYTILWKTDTQVTLTCISIGADCVVFQGEAPLNLFTLTMQNADTIDTIEPTQLGTTNYNNLINKPQINGVTLTGNVSLADIGAEPAITSENMLDADLLDDTSSTHKFATAAQLAQIGTNENNILTLQQQTGKITAMQSIGTDYTLVSDVSYHAGAAKTILMTAALQFNSEPPRGIIISKSNNSSNFNNGANLIAKAETTESINLLSVTGLGVATSDTTYYVWAKSATASNNAVFLIYQDFTS